jgi:hypothetical protein
VGLVVPALSTPLAATAQAPDALQVAWNDTGSCARPALLESEVTRLLGPDSPSKGTLRFDVRVAQLADSGRYGLTLKVEGKEHQAKRDVELESCRDVQEAVALLIATAIDPTAVLRATPPEPVAPPPPPPEPEPEPEPESEPEELESVSGPRKLRWSLLAGASWDYQTLPIFTYGPLLGVLVDVPRVRVSLDARYLWDRSLEYTTQDLKIVLDLFSAVATASYPFELGRWVSLGPGIAVEVGALRVRTEGRENRTQWVVWGDVFAGAVLALLPRERFGIELGMWFGRPIRPPELALGGRESFYPEPSDDRRNQWSWRATAALRVSLGPKE